MASTIKGLFTSSPAQLIINADDFGYFEGVSRGILQAAKCGAITATGVLTNSPRWNAEAEVLRTIADIDVGVHLTLTSGRPVTNALPNIVEKTTGRFRFGKLGIMSSLITGRMSPEAVGVEWDAQISRCEKAGIPPVFLNSHEHIHMFPPLLSVVRRLAQKHQIEWIRWSSPEWLGEGSISAWMRNASLQIFTWVNARPKTLPVPRLIGLRCSGRLNLHWLRKRLANLEPGAAYELMCHPGVSVHSEEISKRLRRYHDWDGELEGLCEAKRLGLFESPTIRLARFRDLSCRAGVVNQINS